MTRLMYDAVTESNIPANATMVAGYVDGHYANIDRVRARFPHARIVTITPHGINDAEVADVETGDLTPAQGAEWARKKVAAGKTPTLYCNLSTWPAVQQAVHAAGLDHKVQYWIAKYDGVAQIPAGAIAKQYRSTSTLDYSVVADYWPGVDPAPAPTPTPTPTPVNHHYVTLKSGMGIPHPDANVAKLQHLLKAHVDAHLVVDGKFGAKTASAVKVVQGRIHEPANGVADARVEAALGW